MVATSLTVAAAFGVAGRLVGSAPPRPDSPSTAMGSGTALEPHALIADSIANAILEREAKSWLEREDRLELARIFQLKVGRVVIDPGHGGRDPGTIGPTTGVQEKDVTLDIALELARLLRSRPGFEVRLTRSSDEAVSLAERAETANRWDADAFISIHVNAYANPEFRGVESYVLGFPSDDRAATTAALENETAGARIADLERVVTRLREAIKSEESVRLAGALHRSLFQGLEPLHAEGLADYGVRRAPFVVLQEVRAPALLTEVSYVTDAAEERRLQDPGYRRRIAGLLYEGLIRYSIPDESQMAKSTIEGSPIRRAGS